MRTREVENEEYLAYHLPPKYEAEFKKMVKALSIKYKLSALPVKTIGDFPNRAPIGCLNNPATKKLIIDSERAKYIKMGLKGIVLI